MKKGFLISTAAALAAFVSLAPAAVSPALAAKATWTASYWNNVKLHGAPALTRDEDHLSHGWKLKSPLAGTINADKFSARWTTTTAFAAGTYYFRASSDDGIRVWIDGEKVVDQWGKHSLQSVGFVRDMSAGDYEIKVEYFEDKGDASIAFNWWDTSADAWTVQYYNGTALTGKPIVTRPETLIKNYWNDASPAPRVKANKFSARWTKTVTTEAAKYKFKVTANGGFRLYVDKKLVMDEWYDHNGEMRTLALKLTAGDHKIRLEYYNRKDPAVLIVGISKN